jgi:hypothetical protein
MAGMCARSVIAMKARTDFRPDASFSTSGAKLASKNSTLSSA